MLIHPGIFSSDHVSGSVQNQLQKRSNVQLLSGAVLSQLRKKHYRLFRRPVLSIFAIAIMPEIYIFACEHARELNLCLLACQCNPMNYIFAIPIMPVLSVFSCQWSPSSLAIMPVLSSAFYLFQPNQSVQCVLSLQVIISVLSIFTSQLTGAFHCFLFSQAIMAVCSVLSISASQHASTGNLHYPACQCRTVQCVLSLSVSVQVLCCQLSRAVNLRWPSGQ